MPSALSVTPLPPAQNFEGDMSSCPHEVDAHVVAYDITQCIIDCGYSTRCIFLCIFLCYSAP